ncbi:universal stress protein [Flagellimonas sp. GZD32]|uniref:universal stress protein n=1 Tax=Flagellimonas cixiensis TaxID=3228750 RepID=UPI0035C8EF92
MLQVLVPTDFSNNSYNALFYVAKLLKDEKCLIHLIHVCDTHHDSKTEELKETSNNQLEALAHRLILDVGANSKHTIVKTSLCSNMRKGVATYAKDHQVDLMVIGNKGKEDMTNILFGNNAMQLVREVDQCPILIVPHEIDFKPVDKIAFASSYVHPISNPNIETLQYFSKKMNATVVPMSIEEGKEAPGKQKNKTIFFDGISKNRSKEVVLPVLQDKVKTILEFVQLWNIGILSMVYYPHHFFLEFIGNGMVKELNTKLKVPFLILPKG